MAGAGDRDKALSALRAATAQPAGSDEDSLEILLGVLMDVLGAEGAVLEVVDERSGGIECRATAGVLAGRGAIEGGALTEEVIRTGHECEVRGGGSHLLPRVAVLTNLAHVVALPLAGAGRVMGVAWAACSEPLTESAGRRHAAWVAAERLGWIIERGRLQATLERAMAQILQSDERMLGRIGLDIHDGPTQHLSVALLEVQLLDAELADAEGVGAELPAMLRPALSRIYETLGGALHEMRELIGHLRPAQFENRRLPEILGDAMVAHESRTGDAVAPEIAGAFDDLDVSLSQKITFYRILQEALTNAHRHGGASEISVRLVQSPAGIEMTVTDNGGGFDQELLHQHRPDAPQPRYGLHGMRDRAQLLGGTFDLESSPGIGTKVRVYLPRWSPSQTKATAGVDA